MWAQSLAYLWRSSVASYCSVCGRRVFWKMRRRLSMEIKRPWLKRTFPNDLAYGLAVMVGYVALIIVMSVLGSIHG